MMTPICRLCGGEIGGGTTSGLVCRCARIVVAACFAFVLFFGQQARAQEPDGILAEIKMLKQNMNAVLSGQTAAKAQIDALAQQVATLSQKIDAMQTPKAVSQQLVWQPARIGSWGQTLSPGAWVSPDAQNVTPPQPDSQVLMMSSGSACANGSCSTGAGRMSLFGRRR